MGGGIASVINNIRYVPSLVINQNDVALITSVCIVPQQSSVAGIIQYILNQINTYGKTSTLDVIFSYNGLNRLSGYVYANKDYGAGIITKYDGTLIFWTIVGNNITTYQITKTAI